MGGVIASPLAPSRGGSVYADGTALVQFLPDGPCRAAWLAWSGGRRLVTSQVGVTELRGAASSRGSAARRTADDVEASVEVRRFSDKALQVASHVSTALSSFVALHLGTAVAEPDVEIVATYDVNLARVATLYRLDVVSPGWPHRWWEGAS